MGSGVVVNPHRSNHNTTSIESVPVASRCQAVFCFFLSFERAIAVNKSREINGRGIGVKSLRMCPNYIPQCNFKQNTPPSTTDTQVTTLRNLSTTRCQCCR